MIDFGYKHDDIINLVKKNIATNTLFHSWLIYGEPGSGKTFLSNEIAKIILNDCSTEGSDIHHLDFKSQNKTIASDDDAAQNNSIITVDDVRKIKNWLGFTAFKAKHKVVLIDDVDTMNVNARNAFLKILEEPLGNAIILLNTSKMSALPATLKSRCVKLKLRKKTQAEFVRIMSNIFPSKTATELEKLYVTCNGDINLATRLIKGKHFDFSIQLLNNKDHCREILEYMSQFSLDNPNSFKAFVHLMHHLYSQIISVKTNGNQHLNQSFFLSVNKVQNILANTSHLNKTHAKELVLNILKTCTNI
jgi:DNA polymerase III delta prime subunit